jgi:inhibitor of growth protein 3
LHKHTGEDGDEDMADSDGDASGSGDEEDEEGKKYCLCQHVSYGDMVACDNPDCPYEWFHWNCVGLKSEPEGRWFCPECREQRKKGK